MARRSLRKRPEKAVRQTRWEGGAAGGGRQKGLVDFRAGGALDEAAYSAGRPAGLGLVPMAPLCRPASSAKAAALLAKPPFLR